MDDGKGIVLEGPKLTTGILFELSTTNGTNMTSSSANDRMGTMGKLFDVNGNNQKYGTGSEAIQMELFSNP